MATGKKFYWLKLSRDFFKRHDIRIIESQENGKDYILFYLKLLVESIDHEGQLRFSDTVPYDEKMLAIITNTNVDIVRQAIKIFTELKLMEICDNKTIHMTETAKMLGYETDYAKKMREYRKPQNNQIGYNVAEVYPPSSHNVRQEIEKEKEIEKDIKEKDKKKKSVATRSPSFVKPTREDILNYCKERKNNIDPSHFYDFYESKNWMIGKNKMKDWKAAVRTWEKRETPTKNLRPDAKPTWLEDYLQEQGGS